MLASWTQHVPLLSWLVGGDSGPIGVDIGSRSVKLVQFTRDGRALRDYSRWEIAEPNSLADVEADGSEREESAGRDQAVLEALEMARKGRRFWGNEAALCLSHEDLVLQSLRLAIDPRGNLTEQVRNEVAGRLPFPAEEAEVRLLDVAEIKRGEATVREMIAVACRRATLEKRLALIEAAGLRPAAVEIEPLAVAKTYLRQFRRDEDRGKRWMIAHIGRRKTLVVIADQERALLIKYVDGGGADFDQAVAGLLQMAPREAAALRRFHGDRRADQQDPEIARSVQEAIIPVIENLAGEIGLCTRYYSVTFRGHPLAGVVLTGGEATPELAQQLAGRLNLPVLVGDPFRAMETAPRGERSVQWDVAAGLALGGV